MMLGKIRLAVMTLVTMTLVGGCSYDYKVQMGIVEHTSDLGRLCTI